VRGLPLPVVAGVALLWLWLGWRCLPAVLSACSHLRWWWLRSRSFFILLRWHWLRWRSR
jgi:hypothetical protein